MFIDFREEGREGGRKRGRERGTERDTLVASHKHPDRGLNLQRFFWCMG